MRGWQSVVCDRCAATGRVFEDDDRGWLLNEGKFYDVLCPSCVKEMGL